MSQEHDDDMFEGLGLPGKEFILPDISSPFLIEEFVVHPDDFNLVEVESYPTSVLDESCSSEVMKNSSIPLSVEAFAFVLIDNPFIHSFVKLSVDSPLIRQESHDLKPSGHSSVKSDVDSSVKLSVDSPLIGQESHDLKPSGHSSVKPDVDFPLIKQECCDLKPFSLDNADSQAVSPELAHNQAAQSDEIASTVESQASSDNPQPALVNEQSPVAGDQQKTTASAK